MKFEFNWPSSLWENYVLIFWWESNISNIGWKVNLDHWTLFIAIVSLGLTNDLSSTVFKISTFQKFSNLNALGSKFDLDVK